MRPKDALEQPYKVTNWFSYQPTLVVGSRDKDARCTPRRKYVFVDGDSLIRQRAQKQCPTDPVAVKSKLARLRNGALNPNESPKHGTLSESDQSTKRL